MRIAIAERLRPYSHRPGTSVIVPGTTVLVQIFPSLIRLDNQEFPLGLRGPVEQFTVCQDLEEELVRVWGHSLDGFIRYTIQSIDHRLVLKFEKGYEIFIGHVPGHAPKAVDRLSLGSHKAQDWELLHRNLDLETLLPLWHRLGQQIPFQGKCLRTGTASLLGTCEDLLGTHAPEHMSNAIKILFQVGFEGLFAPRLVDTDHQGFDLPSLSPEENPLVLLTEGAKLIRHLFIQQHEQLIRILPFLPPQFHAGRMIGVKTEGGSLDFEWSSKAIRRMVLHVTKDVELLFQFKGGVKSFRIRRGNCDRGRRVDCGSGLTFHSGHDYFFDNFER